VRTLVISDLHLGARTRVDVLRRPEIRASLIAALEDIDRLVLLGDVLELRHGPPRECLPAAREVFTDLGRAMAGREIVMLAGNHDHSLVAPWLTARATDESAPPLGSEQRFTAAESSPIVALLAEWARPAQLSCAYPGLWLRPDVYATHGHYLDCHLTVPIIERLAFGAMGRMLGRPPSTFTSAGDYEAVMAPVFAWIDAVAQQAPTNDALNGQVTVRAWRALSPGTGRRSLSSRALGAAFPLAVASLNAAGIGPLRADISRDALRRGGLHAMGEVAERLEAGAGHLIFGHTHRAGPLGEDSWTEWTGTTGVRLLNTGSWTFDGWFVGATAQESVYWPGGSVILEPEGPPVLRRLLDDRTREEIRPPAA
jgi:UDP-2,3-diacylglucosamine pyrophosphatase LpxH